MEFPFFNIYFRSLLTSRIVLFVIISFPISKNGLAVTLGNETDKLALLEFKSLISQDSLGVLSSWNDSFPFCQWAGVTCDLLQQRVVSLDLKDQKLVGMISPHIGNLSFLESLNLQDNFFRGGIPHEAGRLIRLRSLNLSYNSLRGEIPVNLSQCSNLITLDLSNNYFTGQVLPELGFLSRIVNMSLKFNNLTGQIPASIGNLSSVQQLSVAANYLEGKIPGTIGNLKKLKFISLALNNLTGVIPPQFYNLSSLEVLSIAVNYFEGNLIADMGLAFPNLRGLYLAQNLFIGSIPASLSNATNIMELDLSGNYFGGNVPLSFGNLHNLQYFNVPANSLGYGAPDDLRFITALTNCSRLKWIDIAGNRFAGELPKSVGNLSTQLTRLFLGYNRVVGSIPTGISNLVSLDSLNVMQNMLTGKIPDAIGKLSKLKNLELGMNRFMGNIPTSFGNLSQLLTVRLYNYSLEGSLPSSLRGHRNLQILELSYNRFSGSIPIEIVGLPSLNILNVSHNLLDGPLPPEVRNLKALVVLDVSNNKLSGRIPSTLGECLSLEKVFMHNNIFEGTIPDLSQLKGLQFLDLCNNNLSGQVPKYMENFTFLQNLNLSFNNFEGEVPVHGILKNASAVQVLGNKEICGGVKELQLNPCLMKKEVKRHISTKLILVLGFVALSIALIVIPIILYWSRKGKQKSASTSSIGLSYPKVTYKELLQATNGFSTDKLIGSGSFGTVYSGFLDSEGTSVAIKVINLKERGSSKSFMAECQALGSIRHRNLVKILTACSTIDFRGNDFKALVYEFMPNGSLEKWLHPANGQVKLNLVQRLNIAVDVASALHYLHHLSPAPVVHCDLKPSNILLDSDLTAHLSDFGLARIFQGTDKDAILGQFSSAGIRGTIGFAAPEYSMGGPISTHGDVFGFGILLLELFTGKKPTDEIFKEDFDLRSYVRTALAERVMDIVDQLDLNFEVTDEAKGINWKPEQTQGMITIFQIGLACSAEYPQDRMSMSQVVPRLELIKQKLFFDT